MEDRPKILIYLLRRDLRLADNPVFHEISKLLQSGTAPFTHVLPLYVFAANQVETRGFLRGPAQGNAFKPSEGADCTGADSVDGASVTPESPFPEARSAVGKFWRCGPHRAKFLAESVWDLKEILANAGSGLCIRFGYLPDTIRNALEFFKQNPSKGEVIGVWMTTEETSEETKDQRRIHNILEEHNIEFRLFKDEKYFIHDDDLQLNSIADLPDVFTTFRKSQEPLRERPRNPLPSPTQLPPFPDDSTIPPIIEGFYVPESKALFVECMVKPIKDTIPSAPSIRPADDIETYTAHPFHGGESFGQKRLNQIMENGLIVSYKDTRNGLVGTAFSTKLSSYLAVGCLTARQVHSRMALFEHGESEAKDDNDRELLKKYQGPGFGEGENIGTQSVRYELLWRDYMRLCARKFGSKLFSQSGFRGICDKKWWNPMDAKSVNTRPYIKDMFNRFLAGHTGIGLIDASQRELYWTGYTSNRARQNVASFFAKHLHLDWRLGAEWYECMLVDFDVHSNWGNWQYVSGVGNDPREGRIFNPIKQALDYDPKGEYIMTWIPELRRTDIKNQAGEVDAEKLMGLFQAWRIPEEERRQLGLAGLEWVDRPLERIAFSVGRKPRHNTRGRGQNRGQNRGHGQGRGRGSGRGRGGAGGSHSSSNGAGRGRSGTSGQSRWRYQTFQSHHTHQAHQAHQAHQNHNPYQGSQDFRGPASMFSPHAAPPFRYSYYRWGEAF